MRVADADKLTPRPGWQAVLAAAVTLYFGGFLVFAISAQRGLVADGAGYFLNVMRLGAIYSPEVSRQMANLLTEWPLLVALRCGITDLQTLSYFHSFGLYYLSAATLPLSWILLPKERKWLMALPALTLIFGWMGSCYAAISQSQVMALWFWPAAFALAGCDPRSLGWAGLTLLLVIPTVLMHEAMCFLGPILFVIALNRAHADRGRLARRFWLFVRLWLLLGSALALRYTLHPIHPDERAEFITGLVRLHFLFVASRSANPPIVVALLSAAVMLGCCFRERWLRRWLPLWLPAFAAFLLLAGLAPLLAPEWFAPELQSDARSWVVAVPLLLVLAFVARQLRLLPVPLSARPLLVAIAGLAALSQITWQISATVRWNEFLGDFRHELGTTKGLVPYATAFGSPMTIGPGAPSMLASGWTFPSLSIALAPHGRVVSIIANPQPVRWQPFDPARPATLPPIKGVDYAGYVDALNSQSP